MRTSSCGLSPTTQLRLLDGAASRAGNREASSPLRRSVSQSACHRRRRRPLPRPAAAFDSDPLAALDKAAALLNRAITFTEGNQKKKKKAGEKEKPTKKRWVSFSASATSAVAVAPLLEAAAAGHRRRERAARERAAEAERGEGECEGEGEGEGEGGGEGEGAEEEEEEEQRKRIPGRDLLAYLALPASEYSLLDPAWVTREGEGGEGGEEGDRDGDGDSDGDSASSSSSLPEEEEAFVVRFPLNDLVGLPLTPTFRVRVASRSPWEGTVAFAADRAALGDAALDAAFEAGVDATLSKRKSKKNRKGVLGGGGKGGSAKAEQGERGDAPAFRLIARPFASEDDATSSLQAHVTIRARVQLSGPAAALPGPLVSLAAKLVCRAALAATLDPFLGLLVGDYCAWSLGLDRGSLVTLGDADKQQLRLQVAQATAEMEGEMERRRKEAEEAARGEGEVIEL